MEYALDKVREKRFTTVPGYTPVEVPAAVSYENPVVMNFVQEFANLTAIPHPSHFTDKMTAYLKAWAAEKGVKAESDEIGNVIMELPATPGYENAPMVILQGHIDMVPATMEGVQHDWPNDPLKLIWTENSVKADGTSLGADNGTGVAFMMTFITYADCFTHGPMRMIYTVGEEVGLEGAHALDPRWLAGGKYMINGDGGYGGAVISCAGGKYFDFAHAAEWVAPCECKVPYTVEFKGLMGGHSAGVGGGKANGLVAAANALQTLWQGGVKFNLASFGGGDAMNAIPREGKAVVVIAGDDVAKADELLSAFAKRFRSSYEAVETEFTFTFGEGGKVEKVLTEELSCQLTQLMSVIPNNIHTLLATAQGTEASSNLGMVELNEETVSFRAMMRSSSTYQTEQITLINQALADLSGWTLTIPAVFASWPLKAKNRLGDIAVELFREITGGEFKLMAIHAGVECGEFAEKNEDLSIISTGVSGGSGAHTFAEAMNFDQVEVSARFLTALIAALAEEKE